MALQAASSGTLNFNWGDVTFLDGLSLCTIAMRHYCRGTGYGTRTNILRKDGTFNLQERQAPNPMSVCGGVWSASLTNLQDQVLDLVAGWNTLIFNRTSTTNGVLRVNGSSQNWSIGSGALANSANALYYLGNGSTSEATYSGGLAEVAVWRVSLTTDEMNALEKGAAPRRVRASALVFWDRSVRSGKDIKGGLLPASTTGLSAFPHPRVYS